MYQTNLSQIELVLIGLKAQYLSRQEQQVDQGMGMSHTPNQSNSSSSPQAGIGLYFNCLYI